MAYIGGKAKGADFIIEQLNDPLFDGHDYIEPFIGYAHILRRVEKKRSYAASDANPLVIALLRWIKRRESLPNISRSRYEACRCIFHHNPQQLSLPTQHV